MTTKGVKRKVRFKMAVLLGHMLRHKVKPIMEGARKRFENILLVSEHSLPDDAVRATSNYWAIKPVELPEVHADRLRTVSAHLKGDDVDIRRVFLKKHIFNTEARVGVISDIDVVITNPETIARQRDTTYIRDDPTRRVCHYNRHDHNLLPPVPTQPPDSTKRRGTPQIPPRRQM